jgi:hypothetical protein
LSVINATGFSIDISVPFAIAVRNAFGRRRWSQPSKPRLFDQGKSDALKASGTAVASFICTFCDMDLAD